MGKRTKTGGRQKGTPNKVTKDMKGILKNILDEEIEKIPSLLDKIESPEKRLDIITKLLPYVVPKAKDITEDQGNFNLIINEL